MKFRCGICERIKKLKKVEVLLIICICCFMYIAHKFQVREMNAQKERIAQERAQNMDRELQVYEDLQRLCLFKQDKAACQKLKAYE